MSSEPEARRLPGSIGTPVPAPVAGAPPERGAHDERCTLAGTGLGFLGTPFRLRRPTRIDPPSVAETAHEVHRTASRTRPVNRSPVSALQPVERA
jgi:hypothetical protein